MPNTNFRSYLFNILIVFCSGLFSSFFASLFASFFASFFASSSFIIISCFSLSILSPCFNIAFILSLYITISLFISWVSGVKTRGTVFLTSFTSPLSVNSTTYTGLNISDFFDGLKVKLVSTILILSASSINFFFFFISCRKAKLL